MAGSRLTCAGMTWIAAWSVSLPCCVLALLRLCRSPIPVKRRVFWRQLVALTLNDAVEAGFNLFGLVYAPAFENWHQHQWMQVTSNFLEFHIALGFCSACCACEGAGPILLKTLVFGYLTNAALFCGLAMLPAMAGVIDKELYLIQGVLSLTYYAATLGLYAYGIAKTSRESSMARWHMTMRALTYLVTCTLTTFPYAMVQIVWADSVQSLGPRDAGPCPSIASVRGGLLVTSTLYCFNGALSAGTYLLWMRQGRAAKPDDPLDADFARSLLCQGYFDIDMSLDDSVVRAAARRTLSAVLSTTEDLAMLSTTDSSRASEMSRHA